MNRLISVIALSVCLLGLGCSVPPETLVPDEPTAEQPADATANKKARDEKLARLRHTANNSAGLSAADLMQAYHECRELKQDSEFSKLLADLAAGLAEKAVADDDLLAEIALLLDDDGYTSLARPLLEDAWRALWHANQVTREVVETRENGTERKHLVPNAKFIDIVKRVGWNEFSLSAEADNWVVYDLEGIKEFSNYFYFDIAEVYREVGLYPPDVLKKLEELSAVPAEAWKKLKAQDQRDSFALKARAAWVRFRQAQDSGGKVRRDRGKRSFSPTAMGREEQEFTSIWTYQYSKPFIVYIEKPFDAELNQTHLNDVLGVLADLYDWFIDEFIVDMRLKRVRPRYDAQTAEEESWPIDFVLFASREQYDRFVEESTGIESPGLTAMYASSDERIVACLPQSNDDVAWYQSRIANAAFKLLSDFYAVDPIFEDDEQMARPRWSSLLIQEGLADCAASYSATGQWPSADHEFMALSSHRLASYTKTLELLDNRPLFRIRDMLEVRSYGQASKVAFARAQELKVNPMWAAQNGNGVFTPAASLTCYFFHHYQRDGEYVYRDIWWDFLHVEYNGKHKLKNFSDTAGIEAFETAFALDGDGDWDELQQEFDSFIQELSLAASSTDEND